MFNQLIIVIINHIIFSLNYLVISKFTVELNIKEEESLM